MGLRIRMYAQLAPGFSPTLVGELVIPCFDSVPHELLDVSLQTQIGPEALPSQIWPPLEDRP